MFFENVIKAHGTDPSLREWFYIFLELIVEFSPKNAEVIRATDYLKKNVGKEIGGLIAIAYLSYLARRYPGRKNHEKKLRFLLSHTQRLLKRFEEIGNIEALMVINEIMAEFSEIFTPLNRGASNC